MSLGIGSILAVIDDSLHPATLTIPDRAGSPTYKIHAWKRDLVAVKVPGSHYYGGQGQPWLYSPAHFEVFRVRSEEENNQVIVEPVLDIPIRA